MPATGRVGRVIKACIARDSITKSQMPASTDDVHHTNFMVGAMLTFCEKASVKVDDNLHNAVRAMLIVSSDSVNRQKVCETVIPSQWMDWDHLLATFPQNDPNVSKNALGTNVAVWLSFFPFLSFHEPKGANEHIMRRDYPRLYGIWDALAQCKVLNASNFQQETAGALPTTLLDFDDVCKLYILNHITGLDPPAVTEQYVAQRLPNTVTLAVHVRILSALAKTLTREGVYENTLCYILGKLQVHAHDLSAEIYHHRRCRDDLRNTWKLKRIALRSNTRPSMRAVAARLNGPSDGTATAGVSQIPFDTYVHAIVRLPNSMPRDVKLRVYLLASLNHLLPLLEHAHRLVPENIVPVLVQNPILFPDPDVVVASINTLALHGAPFPELNDFRTSCFQSFAHQQRKTLSLTRVLQLYVCAYQKPDIWKEAWKEVCGVLSTQIAKEVVAFVARSKFNAPAVVDVLQNSARY